MISKTLSAALLAAGLLASGCTYHVRTVTTVPVARYATPTYVSVNAPPPPLRVAVQRPGKPDPRAVWVTGHWSWQGQWVWVSGLWQIPQANHVWEPPVCVAVAGGYQYYGGYWRPSATQPPAAYRQPGTIQVHIQPAGRPAPVQRVQVQHHRPRPATVTVQTRPQGRPAGTVTVQTGRPAQTTGTVFVQPNTATQRTGTVTVQPTTTQARPATATQRTGTVTVRPSTVQARPATATQRTGTVTVRPSTVQARPATATQRTGTVRGSSTTVGAVRTGNTAQLRLSCRLATTGAPPGGLITIQGSGLSRAARVQVGGNLAPVVSANGSTLQAQMPRNSRGGTVRVTVGSQSASCGRIAAIGGR